MAKFEPVISKHLQEIVAKNPNIKEVYFDEKGHHYFNKHTVEVHEDNGSGMSKGSKKVESLPGVKQGVLKVKIGKDTKDKKVNVSYNPIACKMDREEILDAEIEETDINHELINAKAEIAALKKANKELESKAKKADKE